jgi:hypothetical protein
MQKVKPFNAIPDTFDLVYTSHTSNTMQLSNNLQFEVGNKRSLSQFIGYTRLQSPTINWSLPIHTLMGLTHPYNQKKVIIKYGSILNFHKKYNDIIAASRQQFINY